AKGAAVDRVAQLFRDVGVERALIDLGGNLYALGRKADGSPWRVGIRHPRNPGAVLAIVEARDVAIATSGDYERYFIHEGVRYSHLLDPRTGSPARELASVTILAPKGVDADGLSTAVFVLGPEAGAQLVESLPGVEAIFVDPAMNVTYTSGLEVRIEVLIRLRARPQPAPRPGRGPTRVPRMWPVWGSFSPWGWPSTSWKPSFPPCPSLGPRWAWPTWSPWWPCICGARGKLSCWWSSGRSSAPWSSEPFWRPPSGLGWWAGWSAWR